MKKTFSLLAVALAIAAGAAHASDLADAEVRKVDKDAGKLTLRHGEIKNLGMPPMTMAFEVDESAQLKALKVGDRVRFIAGKDGRRYTASEIRVQD